MPKLQCRRAVAGLFLGFVGLAAPSCGNSDHASSGGSGAASVSEAKTAREGPPASSIPLRGKIHLVRPRDDIAAAVRAASGGDTIYFTPGRYVVSKTIPLRSGLLYYGAPGAVLEAGSAENIMDGEGIANVRVHGLTFDGVDRKAPFDASHAAIFWVAGKNIKITNNRFSNFNSTVFFFTSDDVEVTHNEADNLHQFFSAVTNNGEIHSGLVVANNKISNVSRMGIEIHWSFRNTRVENNIIDNVNDIAISVVDDPPHLSARLSVRGNRITNTHWAIEIGSSAMTVEDNVMADGKWGIGISCTRDTLIQNNTFIRIEHPFSEDGGYCRAETIAANTIDGRRVNGAELTPR
jgi:hypothetical protein